MIVFYNNLIIKTKKKVSICTENYFPLRMKSCIFVACKCIEIIRL